MRVNREPVVARRVGRASRLPVSECKRDACTTFCGEASKGWKGLRF